MQRSALLCIGGMTVKEPLSRIVRIGFWKVAIVLSGRDLFPVLKVERYFKES